MIEVNKETIRKQIYRAEKALKDKNEKLKILQYNEAKKKLSNGDGHTRTLSLLLSPNPVKLAAKFDITDRVRGHFADCDGCFFFTVSYSDSAKVNHVDNTSKMAEFYQMLKDGDIAESLIIVPEYHKFKFSVHNHGIIRLKKEFKGSIKSVIDSYWNKIYKGSSKVIKLDVDRNFEDYLMKFYISSQEYVFGVNDGMFIEDILGEVKQVERQKVESTEDIVIIAQTVRRVVRKGVENGHIRASIGLSDAGKEQVAPKSIGELRGNLKPIKINFSMHNSNKQIKKFMIVETSRLGLITSFIKKIWLSITLRI